MTWKRLPIALYAALWAPLLVTFGFNAKPWFKNNSPEFSNRINATLVMAVLIGLVILNSALEFIGRDGSALPDRGIWLWAFFSVIWIGILLHFTEGRIIEKRKELKQLPFHWRVMCLSLGTLLWVAGVADFLSKRPTV